MANDKNISEPYILFQLQKTTYGIPSRLVEQMEMVEEFTPVPNAPDFVEGLVFVRGQVIPAINLRRRFGFPKIDYDLASRLVVVKSDQRLVGLIVDSSREFITVDGADIQPPPKAMAGLSGRYLDGVVTRDDRLILVLNIDEILNMAEQLIPPAEADVDPLAETDNRKLKTEN